jgi:hypothetical protein
VMTSYVQDFIKKQRRASVLVIEAYLGKQA